MVPLFTWLSNNWASVTAVSFLLGAAWRIHKVLSKFESLQSDTHGVRRDITTAMTNHLPHIQIELEKINEGVMGMRSDFRDGINRLSDTLNVVLGRID